MTADVCGLEGFFIERICYIPARRTRRASKQQKQLDRQQKSQSNWHWCVCGDTPIQDRHLSDRDTPSGKLNTTLAYNN